LYAAGDDREFVSNTRCASPTLHSGSVPPYRQGKGGG